jgi:hypothetical protein
VAGAAGGDDGRAGGRQSPGVAVDQREGPAVARQPLCDRATDAASGTADDGQAPVAHPWVSCQ